MSLPQLPSMAAERFSLQEVASAAGLPAGAARRRLDRMGLHPQGTGLTFVEAVRLVRLLTGHEPVSDRDRSPMTLLPRPRRRSVPALALSGLAHAAFVGLLLIGAFNWLAADTEALVPPPSPARLVYLISLGPGGGGGGGGLTAPLPPPPAKRAAPTPRSVPTPPRRRIPPPPRRPPYRPVPRPTPRPSFAEKLVPPPSTELSISAPVVPGANDRVDGSGLLTDAPPRPASPGPGTGGGVGAGAGTGIGEGQGAGIGPGRGGGTGGGPYQPGSGVTPPVLTREVRPDYTADARRAGIEGDVDLEIVVTRSGSVGQVRVLHSLGAGLDARAIDAVRQWRFSPARRQGLPVDVVVTVSVAFRLR